MNAKETVRALIGALQTGNFELAKSFLADDCPFSGSVPKPISATEWIGLSKNLKAACPDLNYHYRLERSDQNPVRIAARFTGTHTADLNLPILPVDAIPATGKSFSMEVEYGKVTVRDDKVVLWKMQPNNGAGLIAILEQLGVNVGHNLEASVITNRAAGAIQQYHAHDDRQITLDVDHPKPSRRMQLTPLCTVQNVTTPMSEGGFTSRTSRANSRFSR